MMAEKTAKKILGVTFLPHPVQYKNVWAMDKYPAHSA